MSYVELESVQRREALNTAQRFAALRAAQDAVRDARGSMVWVTAKGREYLAKAGYEKSGRRSQRSLGPRSPETEAIKAAFETARKRTTERLAEMKRVMAQQIAMNRVLGLGRVPLIGANIIRRLDAHGLFDGGLRVLGTYALFAYESASGVHLQSGLTTTEDIDLLLDARDGVQFVISDETEEPSIINLLRKVDRTFERSRQPFRAVNDAGFLVDLIKPMRNPPWKPDRDRVGTVDDLQAAEIEGLAWMESAPAFEAVGIDDRGEPLRMVTVDPRAWMAHKHWLSQRSDRNPAKRRRDQEQAIAVAQLLTTHLGHLPFEASALRMLPKPLFENAAELLTHARRSLPPP